MEAAHADCSAETARGADVANATVSGTVAVVASATDNKGVVQMEIRNAEGTVLASVSGSQLTYNWNTAGLKRHSMQTLTVRAHDARGNVGSASVTVRIAR